MHRTAQWEFNSFVWLDGDLELNVACPKLIERKNDLQINKFNENFFIGFQENTKINFTYEFAKKQLSSRCISYQVIKSKL